jgi:hypothetical protein
MTLFGNLSDAVDRQIDRSLGLTARVGCAWNVEAKLPFALSYE